ncbi:MAG: GGDEF domain-containing protein [Azonexus sp.]|nr:GGDEF domain-containing protein [Azonexus sp.]MCK6413580.1 GGDEF domain-containing protein [Azonexus sp.]
MIDPAGETLRCEQLPCTEPVSVPSAGASLVVVHGRQPGRRYELPVTASLLGRDGGADIVIEDPKVSRHQAWLRHNDNRYRLHDCDSTNGTWLNHRRVGAEGVELQREDRIVVGDTELKFLPHDAAELEYLRRLEALAHTDAITQVFNKGHIGELMDSEFNRARRQGQGFSLLVIDLDHFKLINDNHGHDAGDHVLLEVAQLLKGEVAAIGGILGRFGGEEFVVVLSDTDAARASAHAEKLRAAVAARPLAYEGNPIPLTASIGVATASRACEHVRELFRRADAGVYRAKREGRNCVRCGD